MPADPVAAGRKGGSRRTAAQLAAARRNGFQPRAKTQPTEEAQQAAPVSEQTQRVASLPPACVIIQPRRDASASN